MVTKGMPTARSQRYKANQTINEKTNSILIKDKVHSTPSTSGSDVFPLPIITPFTQAEGAQRAFATVRVLHQSLLHAASPGTHPHDLLQVMASYLHDCSEWYSESEARNIALQKQLDDINSKVITQAAEILQLQDLLEKSREKTEFYRRHAAKADLVPPRRRCRLVSSDADNVLTPDELYQQLLWARDDIQVRDRALERLQVQHTQLQASFEQVLTSSSELLALHVTLLEHHLDLHARLHEHTSTLSTCQAQLLAAQTSCQQTNSLLLESHAKYDTLAAQITQEDAIFLAIVAYCIRNRDDYYSQYPDGRLHQLTDQLLASRPRLRPRDYRSYAHL